MATKSITKTVDIRSKHLGRSFVNAIENASNKRCKEVTISKIVKEISKDQIKALFGSR